MKYTNTIQALQGTPRWAAHMGKGIASGCSTSPTPPKKDPSHRKVAGVEGAHNTRQGGGDNGATAAIGSLNHGSGRLLLGRCGHGQPTQVGSGGINEGAALWMGPLGIWHAQPDDIRPRDLADHGAVGKKLDVGGAFFGDFAHTSILTHQTLVDPKISGKLADSTAFSVEPLAQCNDVHGRNIAICHVSVNGNLPHPAHDELPCNQRMKVISEIRRERLGMLREELGMTWREMNRRLGRLETDATLNQIWNQAAQSITGKTRMMGDSQARMLETTFGKPVGWMDNDPAFDNAQLRALEPVKTYLAWPAAGMSLEQLHSALTPEQRGEVAGMIRAFLSMNAKAQTEQTAWAHAPAPQSTLLTGT